MSSDRVESVAASVGVTPDDLRELLADVWDEVRDSPRAMALLATTKLEARGKYKGKVPPYWEEVVRCPHCGPVYVGPGLGGLDVVGCPWCPVRDRQGSVPAAAQATLAEYEAQTPKSLKTVEVQ